jgi:hypothetical protein
MSDQCRHCVYYQNYDGCIKADCFHHENWIAIERIKRIKELEDRLKQIGDIAPHIIGVLNQYDDWKDRGKCITILEASSILIDKIAKGL